MRGSSLQWFFSKSGATASQLLSFNSTQEQEGSPIPYPPGFPQTNMSLDKQGGSQYPITAHFWQPNDVLLASDSRIFPTPSQAKQMVPATVNLSSLPSHLVPNVVTSAVGGISAVSTVSAPPRNALFVSTDIKSSPSISAGPCQLTIFYNGSVCVYDNVSHEKAQAIMLLAGNGNSTSFSAPAAAVTSLPKVQPPTLRQSVNDTAGPDQSKGLSSSISLSTPVSSSAVALTSEVNPVKPVIPSHINYLEVPKSGAPIRASGANLIPSAVPQARKASLARFLEKRKERVTAAYPYVLSKSSPESFAANSSNSSLLPASN